jgi:hypothetical protein
MRRAGSRQFPVPTSRPESADLMIHSFVGVDETSLETGGRVNYESSLKFTIMVVSTSMGLPLSSVGL